MEKTKFFNIATECITRHAEGKFRDKVAMLFVKKDFSIRAFTYAELDLLVSQFTALLFANGVRAQERVLLRLGNHYFFPIAFFATLKIGAIPVPTSLFLAERELEYLRMHSGAKYIVVDANLLDSLNENTTKNFQEIFCVGTSSLFNTHSVESELQKYKPRTEVHPTLEESPAYLVYTSGTTSYPKGVLHAHRALLGRIPASKYWFNFIENERVMHSGKFNWTYTLGTGLMDPLYQGKTLIVYEGESDAATWIDLMRRLEVTTFLAVPTVYRQILQKTNASRLDVPTLRHAMSAGEHLSEMVFHSWHERFGFPIYEGLGMSECSFYISQRRGEEIISGSPGKIQPGHRAAILDDALQSVPPNTEGMLCIHESDPGLFLGYWQGGGKVERPLKEGWFLTGDYAKYDEKGNIFFMGRRDEIIKSFGYRVSPFEIERVFRDHIAIEEVVAFAEKLSDEKTLIALAVKLKTGYSTTGEELLSWAKDKLARYKIPKKIYFRDNFPRSANGKILRKDLYIGKV